MFRFLLGVCTGIYITQAYSSQIPNITFIVDGFYHDIQKKLKEYSSSNHNISETSTEMDKIEKKEKKGK